MPDLEHLLREKQRSFEPFEKRIARSAQSRRDRNFIIMVVMGVVCAIAFVGIFIA